jgi:hypothetical protein
MEKKDKEMEDRENIRIKERAWDLYRFWNNNKNCSVFVHA